MMRADVVLVALLVGALSLLLGGCENSSDEEPLPVDPTPNEGTLGFINLVRDAPPLTVAYNGTNGGSSVFQLDYGEALRLVTVLGGYDVRISYAGAAEEVVLLDLSGTENVKLFGEDEITLLLTGTLADLAHQFIDNEEYFIGTAADGAGVTKDPDVQFLHGVEGQGALDFHLTASGEALGAASPMASLAYLETSDIVVLEPSDDYRLRVTPAGDATTILYDSGVIAYGVNSRRLAAAIDYFGPVDAELRVREITDLSVGYPNESLPGLVRFGNLVADAPAVDVYFGATSGTPVLTDVAFESVSGYLETTGASTSVNITAAGMPSELVWSDEVPVSNGQVASLYVAGVLVDTGGDFPPGVVAVQVEDDFRPIAGAANVNLVVGSRTDVFNVYFLSPGQPAIDTVPDFDPLAASGSAVFQAGSYDLLVESGQSGFQIWGPERVEIEAGNAYTLTLSETAGGGNPLTVSLTAEPLTTD